MDSTPGTFDAQFYVEVGFVVIICYNKLMNTGFRPFSMVLPGRVMVSIQEKQSRLLMVNFA